jgi:hypothetical protein
MAPTARSADYCDEIALNPTSCRRSGHTHSVLQPAGLNTRRRRSSPDAFTLSELLVAAALGLIVVSAAGSVIISHIRTTTVQSVQLQFQNDWARVSNLIENEVGEGASLSGVTVAAGCPAQALPGRALLFTINVPVIVVPGSPSGNPATTAATAASENVQTSYYQVGNDLRRCGRLIEPAGTLNTTANPVDALVLTNATFNINALNDRLVRYNLTLTDPNPPGFNAPFQRVYPRAGEFAEAHTKLNPID